MNSHNKYLAIREHLGKCIKNDDVVHLLCCHLLAFVYFPNVQRYLVTYPLQSHGVVFGENFSDPYVVVYQSAIRMGDHKVIDRDWQTLLMRGSAPFFVSETGARALVNPFALPDWVMDFLFSDTYHYFVRRRGPRNRHSGPTLLLE